MISYVKTESEISLCFYLKVLPTNGNKKNCIAYGVVNFSLIIGISSLVFFTNKVTLNKKEVLIY